MSSELAMLGVVVVWYGSALGTVAIPGFDTQVTRSRGR